MAEPKAVRGQFSNGLSSSCLSSRALLLFGFAEAQCPTPNVFVVSGYPGRVQQRHADENPSFPPFAVERNFNFLIVWLPYSRHGRLLVLWLSHSRARNLAHHGSK